MLAGVLALAGAAPFVAASWFSPLELNQYDINRVELRYGILDWQGLFSLARSQFGAGMRILIGRVSRQEPAVDDPLGGCPSAREI